MDNYDLYLTSILEKLTGIRPSSSPDDLQAIVARDEEVALEVARLQIENTRPLKGELGAIAILRSLSEKGFAEAAYTIARLYEGIDSFGGIQPDAKKAETYYERAVQLGSWRAQVRLTVLLGPESFSFGRPWAFFRSLFLNMYRENPKLIPIYFGIPLFILILLATLLGLIFVFAVQWLL